MPLKPAEKQRIVKEVAEIATQAQTAVTAEYRGMTVGEMTQLRAQARKAGVYTRVVKNTLARRAVLNTPFECLAETLKGPLILAFSQDDPGTVARVITEFTKTNKKLIVQHVAIRGKLFQAVDVDRLAKMPTLEQALAQLMSVMKAPISQLVRTLAEPQAKLVRTLAAIRDSKQA
jgi:large subunit ribosomal protein L10